MKTILRVLMLVFILSTYLLSCKEPSITSSRNTSLSKIRFDLGALQSIEMQGQQIAQVSVLDSIILTIETENGRIRKLAKKIVQSQEAVSFDVEVETGKAIFTAIIKSNNGRTLYAGSETADLTKDGFEVNVKLTPQDAVMLVGPDSLALTFDSPGSFFIVNKGIKNLAWQVEETTTLNGSCSSSCLLFSANAGNVEPSRTDIVSVLPGQSRPEEDFSVRISSNVGDVQVYLLHDFQPLPDLIVTSLQMTDSAFVNARGNVEVPIKVVVENIGNTPANVFKIATEYTGPQGTFIVAFTVPGQSRVFYPFTSAALQPGSSVSFDGNVVFISSVRNVQITLRAVADSCSGDEFFPRYCRVEETNENNNVSKTISLFLP